MNEKKEGIKNHPWQVFTHAQQIYQKMVSIEIDLKNDQTVFVLMSRKMFIHTKGSGIARNVHYYDDDGKEFFKKRMSDFREVRMIIPENDPIIFNSYEDLLNKIPK